MNYDNWSDQLGQQSRGQPDNQGGIQSCLVFNFKSLGGWDDDQCNGHRAYICQISI